MKLSDLIPVWCEGIDPAYWATDTGKLAALELWLQYSGDAMPIKDAVRLYFNGKARSHFAVSDMLRRLDVYPIPRSLRTTFHQNSKYYVLCQDVTRLKMTRNRLLTNSHDLRQPDPRGESGIMWVNVG